MKGLDGGSSMPGDATSQGDGTSHGGNGGGTAGGSTGGGIPHDGNGDRTTRQRSGGGPPSSGTAGRGRLAGGDRLVSRGRRRAAPPSARRGRDGTVPASTADASPRERILDAAVAEFADHGYLRASLSRIARRAGVAKSLVLYYFGSKDELYSAAVDRALQPIEAVLEEAEPDLPRDLFERLRRLGAIKLQVYRDRPDAYRLIVRSMVDPAVSAEFRQRLAAAAARSQELLYRDVDTSRLRPGVTVEQAVELLMLVGDGLLPRIFAAIRQRPDLGYADLDQWVQKWERYLALVRDGLYKPS